MASIGSANGGGDPGYLVFRLEGADAEVLITAQLMQDIRSRRNGIGAQEQGQVGFLGSGYQAVCQGRIPGNAAIGAWLHLGFLYLETGAERSLYRIPEI